MNERLRKERTEEVIGIAREQLADERVERKLGQRAKVLQLVAGMMRVPDIDGSYLVEFPEYENRDIFPVVSLDKGDRLVSTMAARMPIQQEIIRARATEQWDEQGIEYTEEDIQVLLQMTVHDTLKLEYDRRSGGYHQRYVNKLSHRRPDQVPHMVQFGRPHIVLQSRVGVKIEDEVSTLVYELSHAANTIADPVLFVDPDFEQREHQLWCLRTELAAYATQALVRRVFRTKGEAVRAFFSPALCDVVESHRRGVNGPYTSEGAFEPNWTIERRLGRAGLKHIYLDE